MRVVVALVSLAAAGLAFWLYGSTRTMLETVGFSLRATAPALVMSVVGPALLTLSAVVLVRAVRGRGVRPLPPGTLLVGAMLVAGAASAEVAILVDEHQFAREVSGASQLHGRARAWPNQTAALVYVPGRGIHATD